MFCCAGCEISIIFYLYWISVETQANTLLRAMIRRNRPCKRRPLFCKDSGSRRLVWWEPLFHGQDTSQLGWTALLLQNTATSQASKVLGSLKKLFFTFCELFRRAFRIYPVLLDLSCFSIFTLSTTRTDYAMPDRSRPRKLIQFPALVCLHWL